MFVNLEVSGKRFQIYLINRKLHYPCYIRSLYFILKKVFLVSNHNNSRRSRGRVH